MQVARGFRGSDVPGSSRDPEGHSSAVPVSALPLSGVRNGFDARRGRGSLPRRDGYAEHERASTSPIAVALDQRLFRSHGWRERRGWIYRIRKGARSSIRAFEFF
jgi:hypothetical protein